MPIFEKGVPGFFRCFQDRIAGPSHDLGMLTIARDIHEKKGGGPGGPDPRAFKQRFATFIGIGGSDWACRMARRLRAVRHGAAAGRWSTT